MVLLSYEHERETVRCYMPDFGYVSFVAKAQKAATRKGKDYFILRVTVPKDVAKKMEAEPGEFIFFKARKAQWYDMLDWSKMQNTFGMLPPDIRNQVILEEGLSYPGTPALMTSPGATLEMFGVTASGASLPPR